MKQATEMNAPTDSHYTCFENLNSQQKQAKDTTTTKLGPSVYLFMIIIKKPKPHTETHEQLIIKL